MEVLQFNFEMKAAEREKIELIKKFLTRYEKMLLPELLP